MCHREVRAFAIVTFLCATASASPYFDRKTEVPTMNGWKLPQLPEPAPSPRGSLETLRKAALTSSGDAHVAAALDYAVVYADAGEPRDAYRTFRELDPALAEAMLVRLAARYAELGESERVQFAYRALLALDPRNPHACGWEYQIVLATFYIGSNDEKIAEMTHAVQDLGCRGDDEGALLDGFTRAMHIELMGADENEVPDWTARLYALYLASFPDAADHDEMIWFQANALWVRATWGWGGVARWNDAGRGFALAANDAQLSAARRSDAFDAAIQAWVNGAALLARQ